MDDVFKPSYVGVIALFGCIVCALVLIKSLFFRGAMIVFCDVGNGDGIYIRTVGGTDAIIDSGYSRDMVACLGSSMPLYDTTIEFALITHPHSDHYGGLEYILERYDIETILLNAYDSPSQCYQNIIRALGDKQVRMVYPHAGQIYSLDADTSLRIVWSGNDGPLQDINALSIISVLSYGETDVLLTGDATPWVLSQISLDESIDILKVPHHGSHNGLTEEFLSMHIPQLAVISVGAQNSYGHPDQRVLEMLRKAGVPTLLTSESGTISIKLQSDGTFSQ